MINPTLFSDIPTKFLPERWQERRSHRAVVAASAKEERVMKENYVIYTGEKGEENYVEGKRCRSLLH